MLLHVYILIFLDDCFTSPYTGGKNLKSFQSTVNLEFKAHSWPNLLIIPSSKLISRKILHFLDHILGRPMDSVRLLILLEGISTPVYCFPYPSFRSMSIFQDISSVVNARNSSVNARYHARKHARNHERS